MKEKQKKDEFSFDDAGKSSSHLPLRGGKLIDLKTLKVRNRKKTDYWTFELAVDFVPTSSLREPVYEYLCELCETRANPADDSSDEEDVPADPKKLDFLLKMLGTCLLGRKNRWFYILTGISKCGKTILANLVAKILGQEFWSIMDKKILFRKVAAEDLKASLLGKRMVRTMESRDKQELNAPLVKGFLAGGDEVNFRKQNQGKDDTTTQYFYATPLLVTNELPVWQDSTEAMNNRIVVLHLNRYHGDTQR